MFGTGQDEAVTKRTMVLAAVAVLAALPLVWFTVDANAGDTLLKLTSAPAHTASR